MGSLKSETDDGISSCWNFPEQLEAIKNVLDKNQKVFLRHKADIGCSNFLEHETELEELAVLRREGARCMTPSKLHACRK